MTKRTRQHLGILAAIAAYYLVHEGAHFLCAIRMGTFKSVHFMGIGMQIEIYAEQMSASQLGIFCLAGSASVLAAVLLCACSQTSPSSAVSTEPSVPSSAASMESADAPSESASDVTALELPILDEINQTVSIGTAGSSMTAVQDAAKLLDWGTNTGLDPAEIREAAVNWLMDKGNDEQVAFSDKLALVDDAYQKLLSDGAEELLSSAGLEAAECDWGNQPVESIEAIMDAVGLR